MKAGEYAEGGVMTIFTNQPAEAFHVPTDSEAEKEVLQPESRD
jgi:hypothetical protein